MPDNNRARSEAMPTRLPISIGYASRLVVADCIRKWSLGAALTEREREIVDSALACNRYDLVRDIFADRETSHVG